MHGRWFGPHGSVPFKPGRPPAEVEDMGQILLLAFFVLVGPLAVLYGADSRLDEPRGTWPTDRS